ncbi:jg9160 [Pararge aegeria aegeria]|uniref:Jg9160 protein n=1 Tax=Pararge aegeria aegeria TaxID=348720 RepID=A0A8S4QXM0_9NEOP|nr:jg9160 [Pararge aegeria aegeria]
MKTAMAKEAAKEATKIAATGASANEAKTSAPTTSSLHADVLEDLKASIVATVGRMLRARFAGNEECLLPEKVICTPLTSDRRSFCSFLLSWDLTGSSELIGWPRSLLGLSVTWGIPGDGPSRAALPRETWLEMVSLKTRGKRPPPLIPRRQHRAPPPRRLLSPSQSPIWLRPRWLPS